MIHIPSLLFGQVSSDPIAELIGTIDEYNRTNTDQPPCPEKTETIAYIPTTTATPSPTTHEVEAISGEKLQISVLSEAQAQTLFDRLKKERLGLNTNCLCGQRAHVMTRIMENEGISSGKVFVRPHWNGMFGNQIWPKNGSAGKDGWSYHVAPFIFVKKGEKIEQQVLDPALFEKPVALSEWRTQLDNAAEPFISSRYNLKWQEAFETRSGYLPQDVQASYGAIERGRCSDW